MNTQEFQDLVLGVLRSHGLTAEHLTPSSLLVNGHHIPCYLTKGLPYLGSKPSGCDDYLQHPTPEAIFKRVNEHLVRKYAKVAEAQKHTEALKERETQLRTVLGESGVSRDVYVDDGEMSFSFSTDSVKLAKEALRFLINRGLLHTNE